MVKFDVRMGFLFKSHGFVMGIFCSPDCSSKYYDKDFMVKLNNNAGHCCFTGYRVDSSHSAILIAVFFLFCVFFLRSQITNSLLPVQQESTRTRNC